MRFRILLPFLALLLIPSSTFAADDAPGKLVDQFLRRIKATGNRTVVIDYVNWAHMYSELTDDVKKNMGVTSVQDLEDQYRDWLGDPATYLRKKFDERLKTMPFDKQQEARENFDKMVRAADVQHRALRDEIAKAKYEVGKSYPRGDKATVDYYVTIDGKKIRASLELHKLKGRWYLTPPETTPPTGADGMTAGGLMKSKSSRKYRLIHTDTD